ncbi:MAG: hypothetical protein CUN55_05675 [Phototrophicales bacterium]|nr:MAG: hypothetical protein CUN55_05675 [Phototrophicales bacterium]
MTDFLLIVHGGFSTAYILFSAILGVYAAVLAGQNQALSGNFWGAMWTNTFLASAVFIVTIILSLLGEPPQRTVYYLYTFYFAISLPGVYAIMQGNDNRNAALAFGIVALFNSAAAYRAQSLLY